MSVLVVEDDARLATFLEVLVRRCGLTCHRLDSGELALDAIRTEKYSVVLLDLMLPGMSGFEVVRSLRATHPHLLRRIIVLTAASQASIDRQLESQSMIWQVIRKPFDVGELSAAIDDCSRFHTTDWPTRQELSSWLADRAQSGGAAAVVVAAIDRMELHAVAAHGFRSRLIRKSFPLPLAAGYPICVAARTGKPVWLASVSGGVEYPLCSIWTQSGSQAIAALPMRRHDAVVGAIGWSFAHVQEFNDKQRAHLLEAAAGCVAMIPATLRGYLQIS